MSTIMRRELCREATGPTEEEFASEGATFLVGMIRPAHPNRLAPQYKVTPRDDWFYPMAYVDDIGVKVGEVVDAIYDQDKPVAQVQAELRSARREQRRERHTQTAASALARWLAREGGAINGTWAVPTGEGHGVLLDAHDEYTVRDVQQKARELAKLYNVYYSFVPGQEPGEYLAAFVTEARYTPLDFATAIELADATTDANLPVQVDKSEPGKVTVTADEAALADGVGAFTTIGSIFDAMKGAFGPKKPEAIKKKIAKLEEQLTSLRTKLEEAEAAAGFMVVGNIYSRFRGAEAQHYEGYDPDMFEDAADVNYEGADPRMFRNAEAQHYEGYDPRMFRNAEDVDYGEVHSPAMFRDAEDVHYVGNMPMGRLDLEAEIMAELREMVADGEIDQWRANQMIDRTEDMPDEELAELLADLQSADESGSMATALPMSTMTSSPVAPSSSPTSRRSKRKQKRRQRRRKMMRRASRRQRRRRKSRGGGGTPAPAPQIIVIREGGGGNSDGGDGGEDEGEYEDEGSDGVGSFAYGGPGYGDAALRMGRVVDLPRSPNGYVINYPVG